MPRPWEISPSVQQKLFLVGHQSSMICFLWCNIDKLLVLHSRCIDKIFAKYYVTFKLAKYKFFSECVKFVEYNIFKTKKLTNMVKIQSNSRF